MAQYVLEGFPRTDIDAMKAAYRLVIKASAAARKSMFSGQLAGYKKYFESNGTKHLLKVASVVNDIDDTIRTKKVRFVYAGPRVHRAQPHVCGNRVKPPKVLSSGTLAEVEGRSTSYTGKFEDMKVHFPATQTKRAKTVTVQQGWEMQWLPTEGLTVYIVPKSHDGTPEHLAETIYHELSHAVANTDDIVYNEAECLRLAAVGLASRNAENYCLFARTFM